jgi:hypothetical protein
VNYNEVARVGRRFALSLPEEERLKQITRNVALVQKVTAMCKQLTDIGDYQTLEPLPKVLKRLKYSLYDSESEYKFYTMLSTLILVGGTAMVCWSLCDLQRTLARVGQTTVLRRRWVPHI